MHRMIQLARRPPRAAALSLPSHAIARHLPIISSARSLASAATTSDIDRTRNVGIIAHIDAGKTTTTERMLLLAGVTRAAGSVDDGDTVMDHLHQERERGITIQAAATAFSWRGHPINLIDTPGHVDFTIEVERSTRVLDGAALIVDAVAGAQAQTETVWRQADAYGVPAVAFVNKLDREGADFERALASLEARLGIRTLPLQMPLSPSAHAKALELVGGGGDGAASFGLLDLITGELLSYGAASDAAASRAALAKAQKGARLELLRHTLSEDDMEEVACGARLALIERVADLDPDGEIGELYLSEEPVPSQLLTETVRRLTLTRQAVPALCGASLKGVGVEALLDAIADYLPSPADRQAPTLSDPDAGGENSSSSSESDGSSSSSSGSIVGPIPPSEAAEAVALAFKVVHDERSKKPLVWLRVYNGDVRPGEMLLNPRNGESERLSRLHMMNGEETRELTSASAGAICLATGLKHTQTGDTLLLRPYEGCTALRLPQLKMPTPVFFTAVEVASSSQQNALDAALSAMCLEDPSVHVRLDNITGQQLIGGMGELHLQIVADRLRREHKLELFTGKMQVAYREGITGKAAEGSTDGGASGDRFTTAHAAQPGGPENIEIVLAVRPARGVGWAGDGGGGGGAGGGGDGGAAGGGEIESVKCSAVEGVRGFLQRRELVAAFEGLTGAGLYGPLHGYPLHGIEATLLSVRRPRGTGPEAIRKAAAEALSLAIEASSPVLLEPLMKVELRVPEHHLGGVLKELTGKRRADVHRVASGAEEAEEHGGGGGGGGFDTRHLVQAEAPLSSLVGYADALRSKTAGEAALTLEFERYRALREEERVMLFEQQQYGGGEYD